MVLALLTLLGCSDDKGWETGLDDQTPIETGDSEVHHAEDYCNGFDLLAEVTLVSLSGEPCDSCVQGTYKLHASLTNVCEEEVGTIFNSDCTVSSWVVTDADGQEHLRYDRDDCGTQQRRVDMDVGEVIEDDCDERVVLLPGTYTLTAKFDDASNALATRVVTVTE